MRTDLINQIRDLVHALGSDSIYLNIYETRSYYGTKDGPRDLQRELDKIGVRNRFVMDETSRWDIVDGRPRESEEG